jgi:hypothetical protein
VFALGADLWAAELVDVAGRLPWWCANPVWVRRNLVAVVRDARLS